MLVTVATAAGVSDTGGGGGGGGGVAPPTTAINADRVSVTNNNNNINNNNNCYRAVPVVVSSVPSISCQNGGNGNVSNVHIVQTSAPAVMMLTCVSETSNNNLNRGGCTRTFASTEAQTDEVPASAEATPEDSNNVASNNREQRRRERRERRHQRRAITNHNHINHEQLWATHQLVDGTVVVAPGQQQGGVAGERLPDILHSHLPPPYSTLPLGLPPGLVHPQVLVSPPPPPAAAAMPSPVLPVIQVQTGAGVGVRGGSPPPPQAGIRFPFQVAPTGRRRSRRTPRGPHYTPEEEPKSCCGVIVTQTVSIRWFIVMIAFVGICCAVVGTVLGAMKASGREHLTVSLLMIGVGIVLITVSGVAWRLTAHDAPSCRVMLGLSRGEEGVAEPNRRFVPRLPPSYGRPHHPYAAMMYPEFQYRPPPPSYQASMQEYRLRLLLLDRHAAPAPSGTALSPPPTYRSHPGTLRAALNAPHHALQDFSRPPSHRSRTSSARPTLDPNGNLSNTPVHSRDASLSLSETCGGSAVNVISVHGTDPESLDSIKMVPDQDLPLRMMIEKGSGSTTDLGKDGNLVTIVSTGNDSSPVIVTVSGSTTTTTCGSTSQGMDAEMEILAHL